MKEDLVQKIEVIVDQHTLLDVMTALEFMCYEKADHIRHNWQDKVTASPWDKAGKAINGILSKVGDI